MLTFRSVNVNVKIQLLGSPASGSGFGPGGNLVDGLPPAFRQILLKGRVLDLAVT